MFQSQIDDRHTEKPLGMEPSLGRQPGHGTKQWVPKDIKNFSIIMELVTQGDFEGAILVVIKLESPMVGPDLGKTCHQVSLL